MRTLPLGVLTGALLAALAGPVAAQDAKPGFTVTFSGELRVYGFAFDNIIDFADTGKINPVRARPNLVPGFPGFDQCRPPPCNKDSQAFYFQRWRLFTTVESADLKARAVWGLEVGDMTWGAGGGASGDEYGTGTNTRNAQGQGGALGADGVNVETKNLYLQFELPWVPGLSLLLGAHAIQILDSPVGAFLDDDAFGIQLAWRQEPVAVQLWTAKVDEGARESADDNTFYAARLWVDVTKDLTVSLEGLIVDAQCFGRRAPVAPATTGTCFSAGFGDNLWVGSTVRTTLGPVRLDGSVVYGQRLQLCPACDDGTARARGWGLQASARAPVGPVSLWGQAWYTTGDDRQVTGGPSLFAGIPLTKDSDKLPLPIHQASWLTGPLVAEWLFGLVSLGSPGVNNQNLYDPTGTYGVGSSAIVTLTPALSAGAGLAYVGATDAPGIFGNHLVELDAAVFYQYSPNLLFTLLAGYLIPDTEDHAWGIGFRTRFLF
jgi:hypothetical protein